MRFGCVKGVGTGAVRGKLLFNESNVGFNGATEGIVAGRQGYTNNS